jgi:epoxyqueuosine reductase QueG
MSTHLSPDPHTWIDATIKAYCSGPDNALTGPFDEPAWAEPLVAFASGTDVLWDAYKEHVGPFHFTPLELYSQTFPEDPVEASELTVISWVLPQTEATKADNRKENKFPAERWARSRIMGEAFNNKLRQHVVDALAEAGVQAVAPMLSPLFESRSSERFVYASTWSERHAAYAAGLGTFGICDGLITPAGKAMRVGSVIARVHVPPTPRPYADDDHQAYCLYYSQGLCGRCIPRCPVGALSKAGGHDKRKCRAHLAVTRTYVESEYGFQGYGCGLCQTGVPCESKIPTRDDL